MSGGHSLLGTAVVEKARDVFTVELTLWHLFEAQTVANLAATIDRLRKSDVGAADEHARRTRRG